MTAARPATRDERGRPGDARAMGEDGHSARRARPPQHRHQHRYTQRGTTSMDVIDWLKLILAGIVASIGLALLAGYILLRRIDAEDDRWP